MDFARIRAVEVKVRVKEREGWIGGRRGIVDEVTLCAEFGRGWRQFLVGIEIGASNLSLWLAVHQYLDS